MKKAFALLFAAALFSVTAPAAIIIDDFDDAGISGSMGVSDNTVNLAFSSTSLGGLTGVLGGSRELGASCTGGCVGGTGAVATYVESLLGNVAMSSNVAGAAYFLYNSLGAGLSGVDFSANGTAVKIDLTYSNQGSGGAQSDVLRLVLGDWNGNSDSIENVLGAAGTYVWNVASFNIDPSAIKFVRLEVETSATAPDMSFDNFRAEVPEPGTYAMLGAGLAGLALLRRRTVK